MLKNNSKTTQKQGRFNIGFALLIFLSTTPTFLKAQIPDFYPDDQVNPSFLFYENKGQLVDFHGGSVEEVFFYHQDAYPKMYLQNSKISFLASTEGINNAPDSVYRIDMSAWKADEESIPFADEMQSSYLNFYYPHCSEGITNVHGYQRTIYENFHNHVDLYLTSNQLGHKMFFVTQPGGDPNNIEVKFEGQSSIIANNNNLRIYMDTRYFEFSNAIAYEVDAAGTLISLNWQPTFVNLGNGVIKFSVGNYDQNNQLVIEIAQPVVASPPPPIQNNEWTTYYGGSGNAFNIFHDVETDANDSVYITGYTNLIDSFPLTLGSMTFPSGNDEDIVLVKFDNIAQRQWATYLGGNNTDIGFRLVVDDNAENIYVTGRTQSTNLPVPTSSSAIYHDNDFNFGSTGFGQTEAYISRFNKNNGFLDFNTYFGISGENTGRDIEIDDDGNIYVVGMGPVTTIGNNFSTTGNGFIAKFDNNFNLIFSTQFGDGNSNSTELEINAISIDNNKNMFIAGAAILGLKKD